MESNSTRETFRQKGECWKQKDTSGVGQGDVGRSWEGGAPKQSIYENTTKNFITLYAVLIKYPGENNVRERGSIFSYSSKLQSTMAEKLQHQELEATGHIAYTVKKLLSSHSPFHAVWDPIPWNGATHSGRGFPPQLT